MLYHSYSFCSFSRSWHIDRILITGSEGLVGRALRPALKSYGYAVAGLDVQGHGAERGDVRDAHGVHAAVDGCCGIIHLAAVSRVIWGERDPETCWETNVGGLGNVIGAMRQSPQRPWLLFASSREVYGQPDGVPVVEDAPLRPVNVYGRSKVEGERLVEDARNGGCRTAIVRLSNVYGCTRDHPDRVVPEFARAAVAGESLRVDGEDHTFDFTHIDDTVRGLVALVGVLDDATRSLPPPIHLLTGRPHTLGQLAALAVQLAGTASSIIHAPPREFDVSRFYGDPARAACLLGWKPQVTLSLGLARLIRDFEQVDREEVCQ